MEIDENLYKALCTGRIYVQKDEKGNVIATNTEDPSFYTRRDTDIFWYDHRYYQKIETVSGIDLYDDVSKQIMDRAAGCYSKEALSAYVFAHQEETPFFLAVCDIDNFKCVNDTYGHHCGDLVIQKIGTLFSTFVGESGLACRWGGDEFVLIIPLKDQDKLEKIQSAVASEIFPLNSPITITVGITKFKKGDKIEKAIQRADTSLYNGKKLGRNIAVMDGTIDTTRIKPKVYRLKKDIDYRNLMEKTVKSSKG